MYMQKESGKRESPYKGILRFAKEKKSQLSFAVVLSVFILCLWRCSIYCCGRIAAKGIGKQFDDYMGNSPASNCSMRVSSKTCSLREIYFVFPQSSL